MAAFEHVRDMNDVALRPRMLRTVVRDFVPDDKRSFGSPSQLSKVISMVKTHGLLSESVGDPADKKLASGWSSAVDSWVDRLLELVANEMPDKCWAGIYLLGITCQECSPDRFLSSYTVWFQKCLSHIQLPEASHFVKVAACASMSDLLTRLGGFPSVKKDGAALAGRAIQPVVKLLNEDQSEAIRDGSVNLLCTAIMFFPFSVSRHYEIVENAIASKLLSVDCSFDTLKKLSYCLALLPKSRGDEDGWTLMMQKILLRLNSYLTDTFQGFEEDNKSHEVIRLLVQPGKDLPCPFGEVASSGESSNTRKRSETLSTSSVSALILCCCTMLTNTYPVQVSVPVRSLLSLVERVLMVDGSLPNSQRSFVTAMQQEFLSSDLPVLHRYSLELLTAIIKSVRSQLLPHAGSIVRLISVYFKRCTLPELRAKMYSIVKMLLISMGVGMAACLAQEVINNAFSDLSPVIYPKPSTEASPFPSRKKRKHDAAKGAPEEGRDGFILELRAKNRTPNLISLRIAALEAVEALLTVGGALRSEGWRSNLDLLLINMAKNPGKEGLEERHIYLASDESTEIWANVQLAALRALLASFLSSRIRSPYLPQGLELFREGKQETGTKIAEFCAHAILVLEVLIHPRTLQLDDFPTANCTPDEVGHKYPENTTSANLNYITPFLSGIQVTGLNILDSDHDDLYDSWLENGNEPQATVSDPIETMKDFENPSKNLIISQDKIPNGDSGIRADGDVVMVESDRIFEPMPPKRDSISENDSLAVVANTDCSAGDKMVLESIASGIGASQQAGNGMASNEVAEVAKTHDLAGAGTSTTSVISDKGKEVSYEIDNESDAEDFPDIVVADPDSDSE